MFIINKLFGQQEEIKESDENVYIAIFLDILMKRKNKLFTIGGMINTHSQNTKKKVKTILNDTIEIKNAITTLQKDSNIICYKYCENNQIYYVFEYSITPTIRRTKEDVKISINEIDTKFSCDITIDTIKKCLLEPYKYVNFNPLKIKIRERGLLSELIISNEEQLFIKLLEKYSLCLTEDYETLLKLAITKNNSNIVNAINKHYYEKDLKQPIKQVIEKKDDSSVLLKIMLGFQVTSVITMCYIIYNLDFVWFNKLI